MALSINRIWRSKSIAATATHTKMKTMMVLCALVAAAAASACVPSDGHAGAELLRQRLLPALRHEEVHDERGQYALRYVTAEGTVVSERGWLVPNADNTDYVMVFEGENTVIGEDGKPIVTKYSAGLDGFKVEGDHLPKATLV